MLTVNINEVELTEEVSELDPRSSLRYAFPLSSAEGTGSTAAVYFELDPGNRLSRHSDSAEEVLVVLSGTVEASVGDERSVLGAGAIAVVPAMAPHEVTNVGAGVARVVGVFSSSAVVSTFEQPAAAGAEQVFVIGAAVPMAAALADSAA